MKQNKVEFTSFNDGICSIYSEDEEGNKKYKYERLGFSVRSLGYKRYFAAKAAQVKTDRVIRIPNIKGIDNHDIVEIKGEGKYYIEFIQTIFKSNPISLDLTLSELEIFRGD